MSRARRPPVVLIIRDGWGHNPHPEHDAFNAVKRARTPVADRLARRWPSTLIRTSGEDVGLPSGTMGNSEVGHQNIGAGRVVEQEVMRITRSIRDGSFFENRALIGAFEHARRNGAPLHLLGLVSDGQVHSDQEHLYALLELARRREFPADRVLVHVITDGRDTPPRSGLGFVTALEEKIAALGVGRIASVMGRYYAMDRDHRWDRVALAYTCLTGRSAGPGRPDREPPRSIPEAASAVEAVRSYYDRPTEPRRLGDEFIVPTRVVEAASGGPWPAIGDGSAVIFFNFRGDRPREITRAFVLDDAEWAAVKSGGFERGARLKNLHFCTMSDYEEGLPVSAVAVEKPPKMPAILGELVAGAGLTQLRCAETEKYPHVTFFFNDYREQLFAGENRLFVPSPREVSTYDQKPEMSAAEVCAGVRDRLGAADAESLIVVNFANPDMVGHTGNLDAVIRAVEVTDDCVGRLVDTTLARGGSLVVTADHGNAEQMWDPRENCPHTAHTTYEVPLHVVGDPYEGQRLRDGGRLADIAPTLLQLLDLEQPAEMTGVSLLESIGSAVG